MYSTLSVILVVSFRLKEYRGYRFRIELKVFFFTIYLDKLFNLSKTELLHL